MTKKVTTHVHFDLDAVASAWAAGARDFREIIQIPAGAKTLPPESKDTLVLDHSLGDKGDEETCAFKALCIKSGLQFEIPEDLINEINEQDTKGRVERPAFGLGMVFAAFRKSGMDDGKLFETFVALFDGIREMYLARREAEDIVSNRVPLITASGHKFLLLEGGGNPMVGIVANEEGFCGSLFADGNNLGVTRYPGHDSPDLRELKGKIEEEGWFFHPAGFLAARGSRKSPATSPSKYSIKELADIVATL